MAATASITASRSSDTVPPLVSLRLSRPAGGVVFAPDGAAWDR